MNYFWEIFWAVVVAILTGLGSYILKYYVGKLKGNQEQSNFWLNSDILNRIVECAVTSTNQTFVDDIKKECKKLTEEQKKEAFNLTKQLIEDQLTPKLKEFIRNNFGDYDKYIDTLIEVVVNRNKK